MGADLIAFVRMDMVKTSLSRSDRDEQLMGLALVEAEKAGLRGEVPVGAVLVDHRGTVLAADGNRTIELADPCGHAEILALRAAGRRQGNYRLLDTTLYVTLEPCAMCAAALVHARVARLVFGAVDPKAGAVVSRYNIGRDQKLNHGFALEQGLMAAECAAMLKDFFRQRRKA